MCTFSAIICLNLEPLPALSVPLPLVSLLIPPLISTSNYPITTLYLVVLPPYQPSCPTNKKKSQARTVLPQLKNSFSSLCQPQLCYWSNIDHYTLLQLYTAFPHRYISLHSFLISIQASTTDHIIIILTALNGPPHTPSQNGPPGIAHPLCSRYYYNKCTV